MPTTTNVTNGTRRRAWMAVLLPAMLSACAPVFSDLQSAKVLEPGRVEITPSASYVSSSCDPDDDCGHIQDHFGAQVGVGVLKSVELRGRYEHVSVIEDGPSAEVVGFGPKIGLVKDRLAFYVPIGRGFGGEAEAGLDKSWAVLPTLLATVPAHRNVEVNASAKYLVPLQGGDDLLAFNLGLGVGDLERWAIRPEVGLLVDPGDEGRFFHLSLGLSFRPR
jgi:hypothetical protein